MSEIRLAPLTDENREEYLSLQVYEKQKTFVEPPEESLADRDSRAWNIDWTIECIYEDDCMVGYAMHGMDEKGNVWLDRFMIDRQAQGRGWGTEALTLLLDKIKTVYPHRKNILLSVEKHNEAAVRMYEKFGFRMTDQMDGIYPVMIDTRD